MFLFPRRTAVDRTVRDPTSSFDSVVPPALPRDVFLHDGARTVGGTGMADWRRSHTCGELRLDHEGTTVTLCGWVGNWRDHRGVVFIDLRDRYGSTQVVFHASRSADAHETARGLRGEYVVSVTGTVVRRGDENRNPKLATGEIELAAVSVTLLNRSDPSPFEIGEHGDEATEETRLRFRYLDLRRPRMQEIFLLRHRLNHTIREYFNALNFVEIETPILGRSTPEG
ncbi:MAG: OB-fold nucleic acid binding domain-containing protein, partial [Planctomycetia bacterium]